MVAPGTVIQCCLYRMDVKRSSSNVSRKIVQIQQEEIYEDIDKVKEKKVRKISSGQYQTDLQTLTADDETTRIMGCATMWHENTEEMTEMIKSIFRMDEDYSAR